MTRTGIRLRVTLAAVAATTIALLVGSVVLVAFQRTTLTGSLDEALARRADDLVAQIERFGPDLDVGDTEEQFVQVLGPDGRAVAASANLRGAQALGLEAPQSESDLVRTLSGLPVDDDSFRVLSRRITGNRVLHVGSSADVVEESTAALIGGLAITIPLLDVALAALTWLFVGRTLRPVQAITDEVDEIGVSELARRVPDPGTKDEIGGLAQTMNRMLERLEQSVERQQRFVADASHELRIPLTRLRSSLEVELETPRDPVASIEAALGDVIGMQKLSDDLLYLARADEGLGTFDPTPLDLDDIVIRELDRLATRGRAEVDRSGLSGAHVSGDRAQLTRLVRNLLDNAERHARAIVGVALTEEAGEAILTVVDDGPGVDPADADVIFERFGRADAARAAESGGVGLGLAIAREIAERHDGSLRLIDRRPGATFELRLPALP
jgi:signal transduction histidine kinase